MRKELLSWTIATLRERFAEINFPDYQREPNIWSRQDKQRLIDSILRQFDIASLYFYRDGESSLDCIDGRQRINAIMSFLGENKRDEDDGFELRMVNEIYEDAPHPFEAIAGRRFAELARVGAEGEVARRATELVLNYGVTVVLLSDASRAEEFNLQFTRLNLGTVINAGEKLHAMVGDLRNVCFEDGGLGRHRFLEVVSIPTRRYAKEQVAAQVIAQVFTKRSKNEFTRTRHFDLQRLFKEHAQLGNQERRWLGEVEATFEALADRLRGERLLRNRAMAVSTVILAWELELRAAPDVDTFVTFLRTFLRRLQSQVAKGLNVDLEYRYLIDFQRHVTQASVERPAVEARHEVLRREFERWRERRELQGDREYQRRVGHPPE